MLFLDIAEPESVADHMYRMSMLTFLITDPNINKDHLLKVIIHTIPLLNYHQLTIYLCAIYYTIHMYDKDMYGT